MIVPIAGLEDSTVELLSITFTFFLCGDKELAILRSWNFLAFLLLRFRVKLIVSAIFLEAFELVATSQRVEIIKGGFVAFWVEQVKANLVVCNSCLVPTLLKFLLVIRLNLFWIVRWWGVMESWSLNLINNDDHLFGILSGDPQSSILRPIPILQVLEAARCQFKTLCGTKTVWGGSFHLFDIFEEDFFLVLLDFTKLLLFCCFLIIVIFDSLKLHLIVHVAAKLTALPAPWLVEAIWSSDLTPSIRRELSWEEFGVRLYSLSEGPVEVLLVLLVLDVGNEEFMRVDVLRYAQ